MRIISGMFKSIYHALGNQRYDQAETYKKSPYLVEDQQGGSTLLCNTLTREIICVADRENEETLKKFLVEHWYLLPESADPGTVCYLLMQQHWNQYGPRPADGLQLVTILTTTECNARCWYCYETGCKKRTMTKETALDVAQFIESHCSRQKLMLKWFGGEPLCNAEAIDHICGSLQDHGIGYTSMMVTNGLLLDQHSIDKIQQLWHLSTVQITLDGTKEEYERIKSYKGLPDAYERVLNNIETLLKAGIHVDVRLNLSLENYEDLEMLSNHLAERFGAYGGAPLVVYSHSLFEGESFSLTDEQRRKLYRQNIALQKLLGQHGLGRKSGLPKIAHTHCMADDGCSVVVLPGGELGLCEHHCDDGYIGTIYDTEWDQELIQRWKENEPETSECSECFWHPACSRLKYCPGKSPCTEAWRDYVKERARAAMETAYKRSQRRERCNV